jgi:hypothetical protein
MKRFLFLFFALGLVSIPVSAGENVPARIQDLLAFVENSGVTFIRNGKKHNATDAAEHLRKKRDHYQKDIRTPEDFIRLTATKSLMSGKKYQVVTREGKTLLASDWLLAALGRLRAAAPQ